MIPTLLLGSGDAHQYPVLPWLVVGGVVLDAGTSHNPHEHPRCSLGRVTNSPFDLGPWPSDQYVINIANGRPVVVCDRPLHGDHAPRFCLDNLMLAPPRVVPK